MLIRMVLEPLVYGDFLDFHVLGAGRRRLTKLAFD